jgi:Intron-binding protein aquarius N-terminal
MTLVTSHSFVVRRLLLAFVIQTFESLDVAFVKKELASLAQIHIWAGLSSDGRRNAEFEKYPPLRKFWKGGQKRFESAGMHLIDATYCRRCDQGEITIRSVVVIQFDN